MHASIWSLLGGSVLGLGSARGLGRGPRRKSRKRPWHRPRLAAGGAARKGRELLSITLQWDPQHTGPTQQVASGGAGAGQHEHRELGLPLHGPGPGVEQCQWRRCGFAGTAGSVTVSNQVSAHSLAFNTTAYTVQGDALSLPSGGTTVDVGSGLTATIASVIEQSGSLTKTSPPRSC